MEKRVMNHRLLHSVVYHIDQPKTDPINDMQNTAIFTNKKEFMKRKDKSQNGVSPDFYERYRDDPDFFNYDGNIGCWNCLKCISCEYCSDCYDGLNLHKCKNCNFCEKCRGVSNLNYAREKNVVDVYGGWFTIALFVLASVIIVFGQ